MYSFIHIGFDFCATGIKMKLISWPIHFMPSQQIQSFQEYKS